MRNIVTVVFHSSYQTLSRCGLKVDEPISGHINTSVLTIGFIVLHLELCRYNMYTTFRQ